MKLMIASDVHGSAHFGRLLLDALDRERADRLLLLGDLLYHGPRNDLSQGYDPKALTAMLNDARGRLLCVRGNCDAEVDQMVLQFPILADYCVLPCGERLIYATHGHVYNLQQLPPLQPGDILLHGHTHVPAWTPFGDGNLYLNPGSVSLPKEGSHHGYMTLEGGVCLWKTLEGEEYHRLALQSFISLPIRQTDERVSLRSAPCPAASGGAATLRLRAGCFLRRTRRRKKRISIDSQLASRELCETFLNRPPGLRLRRSVLFGRAGGRYCIFCEQSLLLL